MTMEKFLELHPECFIRLVMESEEGNHEIYAEAVDEDGKVVAEGNGPTVREAIDMLESHMKT